MNKYNLMQKLIILKLSASISLINFILLSFKSQIRSFENRISRYFLFLDSNILNLEIIQTFQRSYALVKF